MKWGYAQNYHITLDSGELGIDKCADIIADSTRARRKWSKREGEKPRLLSFFIHLSQDRGC